MYGKHHDDRQCTKLYCQRRQNAEDVARGWGFVDEKNGVEYIRWNRINSYLKEFWFSLQVAKDDFLPDAQGSNPTLWNPSKHEQCRWTLS